MPSGSLHARARNQRHLSRDAVAGAARARRELLLIVPLLMVVIVVLQQRTAWFGTDADVPVRIGAAIVMVALGWALARDLGRWAVPVVFRKADPAVAGTVGFLIRLAFLAISVVVALDIAGLDLGALAVGASITAVVVGLAAQQTFGNLIAGLVLIAVRPFKVGERVRLQAGGVAGTVEGVVSSLGLLYTSFADGGDTMMVPNSVVLSAAVVPLHEPAAVNLRARMQHGVKPSQLQAIVEEEITTPVRGHAHISLEEVDRDEVIMRIEAVPAHNDDGPKLADEVLQAIARMTREQEAEELLDRQARRSRERNAETAEGPTTDSQPAHRHDAAGGPDEDGSDPDGSAGLFGRDIHVTRVARKALAGLRAG